MIVERVAPLYEDEGSDSRDRALWTEWRNENLARRIGVGASSKGDQHMLRLILAASFFSLSAIGAEASPVGEWLVHDQSARVIIRKCGPNLCGELSWSADGKDIGRAILMDLQPDGQRWTGTVVDVRDNTRYLAHISLQSPETLRLDGCVLGGAICDGEIWTRTR